MRIVLLQILVFTLVSCTYLLNIKSQYDQGGRLEFSVVQDGWFLKTDRPVGQVLVSYDYNGTSDIVWELNANYSSGNMEWPTPGFITYGVVPEELSETIRAKPLQPSTEYWVTLVGPGYVAKGKVRAKDT